MVSPGIEYKCPMCGKLMVVLKPADLPSRPFCSSRCKMVDLYKWLNEDIVISETIPNGGETISEEDSE
jgi:endogenous inhibitor of DNA gyrase (YacG/DUF329 family)